MVELQKIRNELSAIEDEARAHRQRSASNGSGNYEIFSLIVRLAQVVRQDIVK